MTAMLPPLRKAAAQGRGGDNMLAHINEREAAMLRLMGGAGTRNPRTGLLEFRPTGDWGSGAASGGRVSGRLGNTGARPDGTRGGSVGLGTTEATKARAFNRSIYDDIKIADKKTGKILNADPFGGIVTEINGKKFSTGNNDLEFNQAIDKWNDRTFLDRVANFFAPLGFTSVKPRYDQPASFAGGDFHVGINPAGAGIGLLGAAAGLNPLASLAATTLASTVYDESGMKTPIVTGPKTVYADDGTGGTAKPGAPAGGGFSSPAGPTGKGDAGGSGYLLPPVQGNPAPAANPATVPPAPLPPVLKPTTTPGAYYPVPGPSPYGWSLPPYAYF